MLGQPYLEEILDRNLSAIRKPVQRSVTVLGVGYDDTTSATTGPTWAKLRSKSGVEVS